MSGIYIPSMETPKSCCECFAFKSNADGYLFCKAKRIAFGKEDAEWLPLKTPNWCPLVPVPEHGRLIDADALCDKYEKAAKIKPHLEGGMNVAVSFALTAPTIIPADKEGKR